MPASEHRESALPAVPRAVPARVGHTDVARIESATRTFRAWDHERGGGSCNDALEAYLSWTRRLLGAAATDAVAERLYVAVADLHNLAGWTAFDTGRVDSAHRHLGEAVDLARLGHSDTLLADVAYRTGRIHLHHGAPDKALAAFQLGQHAARSSSSALAAAILHANQAWASARMGLARQALALLGRCMNQFARADPGRAPSWAAFFDSNELSAMSGVVHTELAQSVDPAYATSAIPTLTAAVEQYRPARARSRSFALMALATSHLIGNDAEHGAVLGVEAITSAMAMKSGRIKDRLQPLKQAADQRHDTPAVRGLVEQIAAFTAMTPGCGWATTPPQQLCTAPCGSPCTTVWRSETRTA